MRNGRRTNPRSSGNRLGDSVSMCSGRGLQLRDCECRSLLMLNEKPRKQRGGSKPHKSSTRSHISGYPDFSFTIYPRYRMHLQWRYGRMNFPRCVCFCSCNRFYDERRAPRSRSPIYRTLISTGAGKKTCEKDPAGIFPSPLLVLGFLVLAIAFIGMLLSATPSFIGQSYVEVE